GRRDRRGPPCGGIRVVAYTLDAPAAERLARRPGALRRRWSVPPPPARQLPAAAVSAAGGGGRRRDPRARVARRAGVGPRGGRGRLSDPARRAVRTRRLRRAGIAVASALAVALAAELGYRGVLSVEAPRHAAGDFELYGVGESTMVGEPFHPKLSVPRLLDHMFGGRIAGLPLRIID